MKKFTKKKTVIIGVAVAIVLISVAVCFLINKREEIGINTSTIYLNSGEEISLTDLGFYHKAKNKNTTIDFNAGENTSIVFFDKDKQSYIATDVGGKTSIIITTNNSNYNKFEITVYIGNGTESAPYYIRNEQDMFNVGTNYFGKNSLTAYYKVINDIKVLNCHEAVCLTNAFNGNFNGGYHTIYDIKINSGEYAGLFGIIGKDAIVQNLFLSEPVISGSFNYAGSLAGLSYGNIDRVSVNNPLIINTNISTDSETYTGGLVGASCKNDINNFDEVPARIYRAEVVSDNYSDFYVKGQGNVGGIAGMLKCTDTEAVKSSIKVADGYHVGGFAGAVYLENDLGYVHESYSLCEVSGKKAGALFGLIDGDSDTINLDTVFLGLYFLDSCALHQYADISMFEVPSGLTNCSRTSNQLRDKKTFVFFIDKDLKKVMWNENAWKFEVGEYPILMFTENKLEDKSIYEKHFVNSEIAYNITDAILVSNKEELSSAFSAPNNTYILTNDIDLNGIIIQPKSLNGSILTSTKGDKFTISNIKIKSTTNYVGFFSSVIESEISNINFSEVEITLDEKGLTYVGSVAGLMDSSILKNITVKNVTITSILPEDTDNLNLPEFAGGLLGTTSNTTSKSIIENVCLENIKISGNITNAGGVAGVLNDNDTIINIEVIDADISAREYVGGIVAKNQGIIRNANVICKITNIAQSDAHAFIGGIAGANFGEILSSGITLNATAVNSFDSKRFYVGGITGYNTEKAKVDKCSVKGKGIYTTSNIGTIILGGIVGENDGIISYSSNKMHTLGSSYTKVYVGGVVSKNYGGEGNRGIVSYCSTTSDMFGEYVGGISYANCDDGTIVECAVLSNSKLSGFSVAGIINYLDSGIVKNCIAEAEVFAIDIPNSNTACIAMTVYGNIELCIANVSTLFDSNGTAFLVCQTDINNQLSTGCIKNCVVNKAISDNAVDLSGDNTKNSYIIITDSNKMKDIKTYSGFDISSVAGMTWLLPKDSIPCLRCLME